MCLLAGIIRGPAIVTVLGISGSPRGDATTAKLVREVLGAAECETEFISLVDKRIGPCVACLDCIDTNVCVVNDDMKAGRWDGSWAMG